MENNHTFLVITWVPSPQANDRSVVDMHQKLTANDERPWAMAEVSIVSIRDLSWEPKITNGRRLHEWNVWNIIYIYILINILIYIYIFTNN